MITILQPTVNDGPTGVRLETPFEIDGIKKVLWYEVEKKYGKYLTYERADAAVVGLLWYALKHGHDIQVLAPFSERLYYTINNYYIPIIVGIHGYKKIRILCNKLVDKPIQNAGAVGTGLSCGVDSLSTVYEHMKSDIPEGYKITHFTFLNVGSNGDYGGQNAFAFFKRRIEYVKACANELGKDLIVVNSNLSELIRLGWGPTHTPRSMSAILALQRLFNVYYFSSTVHLRDFELIKSDTSSYDIFSLSMLSTENLTLFSSSTTYTRVERTRMISEFELSYKYLNVCLRRLYNCGECEKCLRTLLTLEVIGALNKYKSLFNLKAYYNKRSTYINKVIKKRHTDCYLQEIYDEMKLTRFKLPKR